MATTKYIYADENDGEGLRLAPLGVSAGITAFTDLSDVPASYTAQGLKFVRVNTGATALEFVDTTLLRLADVPNAYTGASGKYLLVNAGETGVVFNYPTGITNGGDASPGIVGEYISSEIDLSTPVSLVTNTAKSITSISLTAGDWEVTGLVDYVGTATTSMTRFIQSAHTIQHANPAQGFRTEHVMAAYVSGSDFIAPAYMIPQRRFNLTVTTTIYLNAFSVFTVSTMAACGYIQARRIR